MCTDIRFQFSQTYGVPCAFVVRAPGRVNLIGEHTDYNGFPVFPMALERAVYAAIRPREDRIVTFKNLDPAFPPRTFELQKRIPPYTGGDWGNYVKAGIQGVIDWPETRRPLGDLRGFNALLYGDVPSGVGLSSSSAMVVASALSFLEANEIPYDRVHLAETLAHAERYVGTQGGGMDQAICLLGESGKALKIGFFPLCVLVVAIPEGWSIVICNSLIQAEKSREALHLYNRRPIECRVATALLERKLYGSQGNIDRLADLCGTDRGIHDLLDLSQDFFREGAYGWKEIAERLGEEPRETAARFGRMRDGSLFGEAEDGFQLRKRVRHVLTEAIRVEESVQSLLTGDSLRFGALMNESHRSCRDDYEISRPELDVLVQMARAAGAVGARLTGAGFGGCVVSLARDEQAELFRTRVWQEYYQGYLSQKRPELVECITPEDALFVCKPACGAQVLREN